MNRTRKFFASLLTVIEGVLCLPFFLVAWWVCAVYRSIVLGWTVSGMTSTEKRATLHEMMGGDENTR